MTATALVLAGGAAAALLAVGALVGGGLPSVGGRLPGGGDTGGAPPAAPPQWVSEACRQLRWPTDPGRVWSRLRLVPVLVAAAGLLLAGPAAALAAAAGCLGAPHLLRPILVRRRLAERDAQLPAAVERIAASLRAGAAPGPALVEVAQATNGPLGDDLRRVVDDLERGEALADALARWSDRRGASADVVLAAAALSLGARAGGQVARAVDGVAATLRERREVQAEVRALATQARSSAWLLSAAPLAFAALVATVEPGALRFLLTTPIGLLCLTTGLTLDALGVGWMGRIVRSAG